MKLEEKLQNQSVLIVILSAAKNLIRLGRADRRDASSRVAGLSMTIWSMWSLMFARLVCLRLGARFRPLGLGVSLVLGIWSLEFAAQAAEALPDKINFNRDIRPILSNTCFKCHGPDANKRKAKLQMDVREDATAQHEHGIPIVAGKPDKSEAYRRITTKDEDDRMPPVKSNLTLTDRQIQLFKKWIEQGAEYQPHWAFIPPQSPAVPKVQSPKSKVQNPIDNFILARLEQEKLTPTPEADKTTLIRRVTLDLTGIPPTPAEVDVFLADKSPTAYEKVVDRLLVSPRYGERMAMDWLDGARYADSHGFQADWERYQWPWRDWVINAYNRNMPFNQFTVEQLAGDMLPNATLDQRVATGFNRNHRQNAEGGIIAEEWRIENVMDRVETTTAVWLGLTMGCARCHDHKYDPISQKEFYQFFAFFNNITETGRPDEKDGNHVPLIKVPTSEYDQKLKEMAATIEQQEKKLDAMKSELEAAQAAWEKTQVAAPAAAVENSLLARFALDQNAKEKQDEFKDGKPTYKSGVLGDAADFDGKRFINLGDVANFDRTDAFSFGAWIYPMKPDNVGAFIARMNEANAYQGYNLLFDKGTIVVQFISHWDDNAISVRSAAPLPIKQWAHVFATYDGSGKASGFKLYVNGKSAALKTEKDSLRDTTKTTVPLQVASRSAAMRFVGRVDDVRFYSRSLADKEVNALVMADLSAIAKIVPAERTKPQDDVLAQFFQANHAPAGYQEARKKLEMLVKEQKEFQKKVPTVMVMEELPKPRDTFFLIRGQYDKPGEKITAGTPAALPPMPQDAPLNRLGVAQWIASPSNPLTARVQVNRYWEKFFGTGIVKSSENFGSQAEWPSHPELLDWLATEFIRIGWDTKAIQKTIVMSATYRQSSNVTPQLLAVDSENRLLARGPRFRLQAETIRDNALAIGGLLTEKIGGPSVYPYQPPAIWDEVNFYGNMHNYKNATDGNQYRRSLYTIWKRTTPPPGMTLFDMPMREVCQVRRSRTNTPLQALALLNDTTYVEAARALADRMISEGGATPEARISYAYRRAVNRAPSPAETKILADGLANRLTKYRADAEAAKKLVSVGEAKPDPKLDPAELAAYTITANVILNLDETVTKE